MSVDPAAPIPDDKDWTWVITQPCPDCGFDATELDVAEIPARTRENMAAFAAALAQPGAADRPAPTVWAPLEYACHVRDVCRLFEQRLRLMLTQDDPTFVNWDQDETALAERYWEQDPVTVADECIAAAETIAASFEAVRGDQWQRPGRRSNGSVFTVDTFGRYFLHDLVHHRHDINA
ncbi:MAG TPA: DinB family protein [Jatrophihabitantaceae bacterium]|nr:DinB family protein [Jatrophihabitantaceae bacterium]